MRPDLSNLHLDGFADTYFAGLYETEDRKNIISVKSRAGILLNFGGVRIM